MPEIPRLGARGGGWVVLQFALIAAVVVAGIVGSEWPGPAASWLALGGAVLALAGGGLAVAATRALGRSLTPFPRPSASGTFVEGGPYHVVRHPIYLSGTVFFTGLSLALSPWALALTALLAIVWALKARVEERFLRERFPEYGDYCERTRFRLVPFVY